MREEAKANEESDNQAKDKIDKLNAADSLIFQSEKQLKEFGDKLPAEKKGPIEEALNNLKEAHKSQDLEAIEKATNELNTVWQAASEEMYKASQEAGGQPGGQAGPQAGDPGQANAGGNGKADDGEVTDVDFEEVK
jgi:molecular chaperone DnaK